MVIDNPLNEVHIPRHTYSATTILLLLEFVLSAISLRGSARVLNLVNDRLKQPLETVPSWFSIRLWLLRLGYYKLMRPKQIADDWCWIVDVGFLEEISSLRIYPLFFSIYNLFRLAFLTLSFFLFINI